ncbi:RCC1 domain-containing protein [Dactylosporangium aurantiacum]|uniref:hypothetical protein n=1 Tax=Dactylosporangium aurantiacum TaxID=35754 RepID=UPI001FDEE9C1|nr:hypothetical protein [Dactylosporangium aurantiacum]
MNNVTGATLVDRYHERYPHVPVHHNGETLIPAVGDVMNFGGNASNPDGHVAVVTAVELDPAKPGRGKVFFVGQNQKQRADGTATAATGNVRIVDGRVDPASYNPAYRTVKWLDLRPAATVTRLRAWGTDFFGATDLPADLTGVTAVAAGLHHGLAVRADGTVASWGYNPYGQATVPAGLADVVAVGAADVHSIALKADGTVIAWGANPYGETDVPADLSDVTAIATGTASRDNLALKRDGTVVAWGSRFAGEADVPAGLADVRAIAAGTRHNLALRQDGTVVAWGWNSRGQATVPAGLTDVVAISAGDQHSLALKSDGTVVAWGAFDYTLNGEDHAVPAYVPEGLSEVVAVGAGLYHDIAVRRDGTVVSWGANFLGQTDVPGDVTNVLTVAGGTAYSLAIVSVAA